MDKDWRFIIGFALIGLAVATLFLCLNFLGEFDAGLYTAFAVFCPPSLLCFPLSDVMKAKGGFYTIWSLIGLLNSGLYAVVGAVISGLRKSQSKSW